MSTKRSLYRSLATLSLFSLLGFVACGESSKGAAPAGSPGGTGGSGGDGGGGGKASGGSKAAGGSSTGGSIAGEGGSTGGSIAGEGGSTGGSAAGGSAGTNPSGGSAGSAGGVSELVFPVVVLRAYNLDTTNTELLVHHPDGTLLTLDTEESYPGLEVSPDGTLVAFRTYENPEIYVVPLVGGPRVRLSSGNGAASTEPIRWSADGSAVTFVDEATSKLVAPDGTVLDVHAADPGTGGAPSAPPATSPLPSRDASALAWAGFELLWLAEVGQAAVEVPGGGPGAWLSDGSRFVYVSSDPDTGVDSVHSVLRDGTGHVELATITSTIFELAPNGSRVAYVADPDDDGIFDLFLIDPDGTDGVQITSTAGPGGVLFPRLGPFSWSPDSGSVAYAANGELFVAATDGSSNELVVQSPGAGLGIEIQGPHEWSPDGSLIALIADLDTSGVLELYVVPPDGSAAPLKVSAPLAATEEVGAGLNRTFGFQWSRDSQCLAYRVITSDQSRIATTAAVSGASCVSASGFPLFSENTNRGGMAFGGDFLFALQRQATPTSIHFTSLDGGQHVILPDNYSVIDDAIAVLPPGPNDSNPVQWYLLRFFSFSQHPYWLR